MAFLDFDPEPPEIQRRPFSSRRIILFAVASFGMFALIGGLLWGPSLWHVFRESSPTLSTPAKAGELALDTSERGQRAADGIAEALSVPLHFDRVVSGVYEDPTAPGKSVLLMAGTLTSFQPTEKIDQLFAIITDAAGGVTETHTVDAGPLGGQAKCGLTKIESNQVPVCGWADHGSVGLMLLPGHTDKDAAKRFRELRAAVQKR